MARDNRKIMIPTEVIDSLVSTDLNLAGLRIVLGLLHAQEIVDGWDKGSQIPGAPSSFFVATADLRERVFPPSASDNRALHAALPGLQAFCRFQHIDSCKAGRFISWRFDVNVTQWMVERPQPYALVDLNLVRRLKSRAQLIAYLMVQSRIRMNYPMFEMTISDGHWKVERQKFLRALGQIATPLGATFHVASCYHHDRPELGRLVVKIVTDKTRWRGHALRKFDPNAGIKVIRPREQAPAPVP